ncbi:hypothetical protein MKW92_013458 [Papaver armeniacum]|nr:hypothetical protein MKW92_013458 [Papaver armeniacum]
MALVFSISVECEPQRIDEDPEAMETSTIKESVSCQGDGICEPHIGMEFDSEEAAKVYYDAYGTHTGFVMRVDRRTLRDGKTYCRRLVCNKEGFYKGNPCKKENTKTRTLTREGCKAMIMVKEDKSGRWVVSRFVKEHNHPLVISSSPIRRSWLQTQTPDEKDKKIQELATALQQEKKRSASYQAQLHMVLKDIDEHTEHLSRKLKDVVENLSDVDSRGKASTITLQSPAV